MNNKSDSTPLDPYSVERRSNPLRTFRDFLSTYMMDNTEEERYDLWRGQIYSTRFNSYAEDILYVLDQVAGDPPSDLQQLIDEYGGLYLGEDNEEDEWMPLGHEDYVKWLREQAAWFRTIYEEMKPSLG